MSDIEKFKSKLPSKEKYYSFLTDTKIDDKEYEHVRIVWKRIEMKTIIDYLDLYLKCYVFIISRCIWKI